MLRYTSAIAFSLRWQEVRAGGTPCTPSSELPRILYSESVGCRRSTVAWMTAEAAGLQHEIILILSVDLAALVVDIEKKWTLNRPLPKSSALSASLHCRI